MAELTRRLARLDASGRGAWTVGVLRRIAQLPGTWAAELAASI